MADSSDEKSVVETVFEKITEKIHRDSSSSSSDSDDEKHISVPDHEKHGKSIVDEEERHKSVVGDGEKHKSPPAEKKNTPSFPAASSAAAAVASKVNRIFGREKPVHKVLGGGKPADVFLWRDKKISATVLGTATAIWVLFELLEYHLLTLVCHVLILSIAILFLWSNASTYINKSPPKIPQIGLPEHVLLEFASAVRVEANQALACLRDVASGRDLKKFLGVIFALWILSVVGSWFNFVTLFYIVFVLLHTVPVLYEKYEDEVDSTADKVFAEIKKQYAILDAKFLSKVPRGKKTA